MSDPKDDPDEGSTTDATTAASSDPPGESAPVHAGKSPVPRHFVVLGVAVVGLVIGIVLVVAGRDEPSSVSSGAPQQTVAVRHGSALRDLGAVADLAAAKSFVRGLDPATLRSSRPATTAATSSSPSTTLVTPRVTVDVTASGLQRCSQAIAQQNTDRSLGDQQSTGRLLIGKAPAFVVSYQTPASGSLAAGKRVVLVDAQTCRVLSAIQY